MSDQLDSTAAQVVEPAPAAAVDPHRIHRQANWIQVGITLILFLTVGVTAWSAYYNHRNSKLMAADATWERYMELASGNAKWEAGTTDFRDSDSEADVGYAWFVERGLFAGDQIMDVEPDDPQWQDAIVWEVMRHRNYILSHTFLDDNPPTMSSFCTYRRRLRALILKAFEKDKVASQKIVNAENHCLAVLAARGWPDA